MFWRVTLVTTYLSSPLKCNRYIIMYYIPSLFSTYFDIQFKLFYQKRDIQFYSSEKWKKINHNITKTLQWISVCYSTTNQRTMEGDKVLLYFFYNIFKDYQTNVIWLKFSEVITALQFEKIFLHIFLGRYMINSQSYFSKVW